MTQPSASIVYTGQSGGRGDNSGSAAILDRTPDVGLFVQNIFNQKRQQDLINARQDREDAKRLQQVLKGPDLGKVPIRSQQELAQGLTGYKDLAVQMGMGKVKGKDGRRLDPMDPYDLEAQQMLQDKEFELVSLAEASRNQEKRLAEILEASKDPKYDRGKIADYIERFQKAPSVKEREALLDENPLRVKRTTFDIVKDMAPEMAKIVQESGNKTTIDELIQPENVKILAENWILDHPEDFEAGIEDGRWKDEQGFADALYEVAAAQKPAKRSVTFDEPRQSSGGQMAQWEKTASTIGDYSGNQWGEYSISGSTEYPDTSKGFVDTVAIGDNGGSMKEVQLIDANDNVVNGKPALFKRRKGDEFDVIIETDVPALDETGEPIVDGNGVPKLTKKTVVVDYGKNKNQIKSALQGLDIPTWANTHSKAESSGITPQEFDAKWATLKKGESLTGPDGKTYIKN